MTSLTRTILTGIPALVVFLASSVAVPAAVPTPGLHASLEAWREIPVLDDGRIMPAGTSRRSPTRSPRSWPPARRAPS